MTEVKFTAVPQDRVDQPAPKIKRYEPKSSFDSVGRVVHFMTEHPQGQCIKAADIDAGAIKNAIALMEQRVVEIQEKTIKRYRSEQMYSGQYDKYVTEAEAVIELLQKQIAHLTELLEAIK